MRRAGSDARVRVAGLILLLLMASAAAPVLDQIVWFLAEAPYVEYLQSPSDARANSAALADAARWLESAGHMLTWTSWPW